MSSSAHVYLLYSLFLIGPAVRGTAPGGCRVVADSASQSGLSRCKTPRHLVRDFPLAELLLVFRVSSLITPCFREMQLNAAAFLLCRQSKQSLRFFTGWHMVIRWTALGRKTGKQSTHLLQCFSWSSCLPHAPFSDDGLLLLRRSF
jgi:hypothetical protein